jgi:4-hydroxy 2-oxovalerate aldolase
MEILDCTLRDGGYYTNWDFDDFVVDKYLEAMNTLPVDFLEIGYRSIRMDGYLGQYFYCPVKTVETIRLKSKKKLVIILNEKDIRLEHLKELLEPIKGLVDMVRIAIDPQFMKRALLLAERIKSMGFLVGFNVMYMSKWGEYGSFTNEIKNVDGIVDYFYMVDSFGGVYPEDVINTIDLVRTSINCKLGFHGHNNLELALVNSITALNHGVDIIDSTVQGMGRGAGNLKTELFLTHLNGKESQNIDFNALGNVVQAFEGLMSKYSWGTNLPYMISGSNSLPQKDVMEWVTTRLYSFNSIIRALENKKNKVLDNQRFEVFHSIKKSNEVLIIGGGSSVFNHLRSILEFINSKENLTLIFASSKNANLFKEISVDKVFCLVGREGSRLESVFEGFGEFTGACILPPFPRKMGTYVPKEVAKKTFELEAIEFTDKFKDSHTVLSLQTAIELSADNIYIVGYDGYSSEIMTSIQSTLSDENNQIFQDFILFSNQKIISLTPSDYKSLVASSIYCNI